MKSPHLKGVLSLYSAMNTVQANDSSLGSVKTRLALIGKAIEVLSSSISIIFDCLQFLARFQGPLELRLYPRCTHLHVTSQPRIKLTGRFRLASPIGRTLRVTLSPLISAWQQMDEAFRFSPCVRECLVEVQKTRHECLVEVQKSRHDLN